jgi:hypothetical protein
MDPFGEPPIRWDEPSKKPLFRRFFRCFKSAGVGIQQDKAKQGRMKMISSTKNGSFEK